MACGENADVADPSEAARKDVTDEAPHELIDRWAQSSAIDDVRAFWPGEAEFCAVGTGDALVKYAGYLGRLGMACALSSFMLACAGSNDERWLYSEGSLTEKVCNLFAD